MEVVRGAVHQGRYGCRAPVPRRLCVFCRLRPMSVSGWDVELRQIFGLCFSRSAAAVAWPCIYASYPDTVCATVTTIDEVARNNRGKQNV